MQNLYMKYLSTAKLSSCFRYLTAVLTLLYFLLPVAVTAQVTTLSGWADLYDGASSPGNLSYTVSTGSDTNRLLVVGVATSRSTTGTRSVAITYGGQTLTPVDGDLSAYTYQHTQLYYLDEAGLDAASDNTLAVSISNGTTTNNTVFAALYDNVDQANPVTYSENYNSGSSTPTNFSFSSGLIVNAGDQAVKILNSVRRGSRSYRSISDFGSSWTIENEQTDTYNTGGSSNDQGIRIAVGYRDIPSSDLTDNSSTSMSGSSLISMTGMSLSAKKYFRSVQSGNWNSTSTWQQSLDNVTWTAANSVPTWGHNLTTIQSGHTVTLTANATVSSLTIHGTLNTGTYALAGTAALTASSTGVINVSGTGNFPSNFSTVTLNNGSTVNYNLNGNQNIFATTYSNLTLSVGGTKSLTEATTVNGTLTISRPLSTNSYQLTLGGNFVQNSTFSQGTGTVLINGNTTQTISGTTATTFYNLTVNKSGGDLTLSKAVAVSNILSLQSGLINTTTTNLLSVTNTAASAISGGSATAYINGPLLRNLPASFSSTASYNFPVGKNGNYYPFTLENPTTGTGTITARAEAFAANPGGSIDASISAKSTTEYWSLTTAGNFTNAGISVARPTDINPFNSVSGSTTQAGTYTSLFGTIGQKGITNSNAIGSNRFFGFATASPIISTSVSSVSGFAYPEGHGPSNILSFNVSGTYLISNVTLQPTTNYEISTVGGISFTPVSLVTLPVISNTLNPTPVYIRLKAGLSLNSYTDTIKVNSTGATTKEVILNGTVTTPPVVNVSPASLSGFNYDYGQGPSGSQSFTVNGSNLAGNVTLTAPSGFDISLSSGSGYTSSLSLTPSGSTLNNTTIYVRMKSGFGVGTHVQDVQVSSLYALTKTVTCTGSVNPAPTIYNSRSLLPVFIYTSGSGPSGAQTFEVSGTNLTANITATAPTNFQVSLNGSTWSSSVTLTQSGGTVNPTTVYVRMSTGLSTAVYGPSALTLTSTGATTKSVACSGRVVSSALLMSSTTAMNGFGYQAAAGGPSTQQFIVVSGSSLTNDITITPPTNYEISTTSGSGFQSTPITLTRTSGRVNPTLIYIRLKGSLSANDYNETLQITSSGATAINVLLVGKVYVSPLVSAGGSGTYCIGSNVNLTSTGDDILNRFWEGPNNYYSILQNPTLTNATEAMSGTYSVTGNVVIGGNLIYNGDFESGDVGFGSGYTYAGTSSNALWPEATYTVVASPSSVHSNFSNCADHSDPGTMQMVINGAPVAGVVVWSQSVAVIPGADYEFSYWLQSVVASNPSQLQLYVNGVAAGPIYTANLANCDIKQFIYNTNAGSNSVINLELINQNTVASGNDFAIDDIELRQVLFATDSVEVNVTPNVSVGLTINASATTILENTPVTFTATPVNPGSSPVYEWFVNGNPVGTNSPTFTSSTLSNNDEVTCKLTSSITCAINNPATSNTVVMTVLPTTNFWIGTNSTDWGTASNWTGGYVPAAGDNIEFATIANYGSVAVNELHLDIDRTIGSLINLTDKKLVIPVEKSLIVNGSINTNNQNRILIKSAEGFANGSFIFINESNPVYGTVEMWSKAYIDEECDCGNDKYKWQFFGPPVHTYMLDPYNSTFYGSAVRIYDEAKQTTEEGKQWTNMNNFDELEKFKGYEITQPDPKKIIFEGQLVNNNLNTGELPVTDGSYYRGWHLLSNPYTAAISVQDMVFGSGMEATVYLFTTGSFNDWRNNSSYGTVSVWNDDDAVAPGQYLAIPKNIAGFTPATAVIPSMQGFMVGVLDREDPPATGKTVSFNYGNLSKNTQQQRVRKVANEQADYVYSVVTLNGGGQFDRLWLFTDEACTPAYDNGWDGRKFIASDKLQLYASQDAGNFQIHATNNVDGTYLAIQALNNDEFYTLHFRHNNLESKYAQLLLLDTQTKNVTDITADGSTYSFRVGNGDLSKRFRLITTPVEPDNDEDSDMSVRVDAQRIFVANNSPEDGVVHLYNLSGNLLYSYTLGASNITAFPEVQKGLYLIEIVTDSKKVNKKALVR